MNTCFEHNCYDTHTSNFQGVCLQLDHWFVQDEAQRLVQDAKRWYHGIDSNHAAVLLVLRLPHTILRCKKIKHKKWLQWQFLACPKKWVNFTESIDALLLENPNPKGNLLTSSPKS
jgi:hypothetical protein